MTSNQRDLLRSVFTAVSLARTMDQVNALWITAELLAKEAGVDIGTKPTSLPQAKTSAQALLRRVLS